MLRAEKNSLLLKKTSLILQDICWEVAHLVSNLFLKQIASEARSILRQSVASKCCPLQPPAAAEHFFVDFSADNYGIEMRSKQVTIVGQ